MTLQEEDELAEKLSNLTPMDYSALMRKVRRRQWDDLNYNATNWRELDRIQALRKPSRKKRKRNPATP